MQAILFLPIMVLSEPEFQISWGFFIFGRCLSSSLTHMEVFLVFGGSWLLRAKMVNEQVFFF